MLKFVSRFHSPIAASLKEALRDSGISNGFNPSVLHTKDGFVVAFRGLRQGAPKPFDAFLAHLDQAGTLRGPVISLGEHFGAELGVPVCDPKLFCRADEVWVTFNTGHFEKPNRIFVVRVAPELGTLLQVDFPERSAVEKNWAFFEHDGTLHALYNASPAIVLRETERSDTAIRFERARDLEAPNGMGSNKQTRAPQLTIGTQLVALDAPRSLYGFVGHRRWYWRGKRLYLGSPMTLCLDGRRARVETNGLLWGHSVHALFGDRIKHNPNLFSCTYFAGMSVSGHKALVSYGINDVDFSLAEIPLANWIT